MNTFERATVAALPWLSAAGAAGMTGLAAAKWKDLGPADRIAVGVDAVAFALAARPLATGRATGWWTLYLATAIQPVFAAIDLASDEPRWGSAVGRIAGTAATAAVLIRLRRNYA